MLVGSMEDTQILVVDTQGIRLVVWDILQLDMVGMVGFVQVLWIYACPCEVEQPNVASVMGACAVVMVEALLVGILIVMVVKKKKNGLNMEVVVTWVEIDVHTMVFLGVVEVKQYAVQHEETLFFHEIEQDVDIDAAVVN